jgi:hypothetical protein
LNAYQDALAIVREQHQHQHQQQHESGQHQSCQQQSTTGNQTCSHNQQQVVDSQRSTEHQLQACCASAMYPQGGPHAEAAVHLVQTLLQHQLDVRQAYPLPEALRVYAQAAADKQQWAAAAKAAVQLVAHAPHDTEGVRLLVHAVQVCWHSDCTLGVCRRMSASSRDSRKSRVTATQPTPCEVS